MSFTKTFGGILRQCDENHPEKHWVFHSNLMTFHDLAQVNFSLGETAIQKIENWSRETLINTVVYEDFWRHFAKNDKNHPEKHWVFHSNLMTFRDLVKVNFSLGKTAFCDIGKSRSKNIIKTGVYEVF